MNLGSLYLQAKDDGTGPARPKTVKKEAEKKKTVEPKDDKKSAEEKKKTVKVENETKQEDKKGVLNANILCGVIFMLLTRKNVENSVEV